MKKQSIRRLLIQSGTMFPIITAILVGIIAILNLSSVVDQSNTKYKDTMYDNYDESIKNQTAAVLTMLEYYYDRSVNGDLTDEQARYEAKEAIRAIRYGKELDGYFWIDSTDFTLVMHPILPQNEGTNREQLEDQNGNMIIQLIKNTCLSKEGAGFNQFWFTKSDGVTVAEKRSYSAYFEPWKWCISTGNYLDDMDAQISGNESDMKALFVKTISQIVALGLIMAILSVLYALYITKAIMTPLKQIKELSLRISDGDFSTDLEVKKRNEIGETIEHLNEGQSQLRGLLKDTKETSAQVENILAGFATTFEQMSSSIQEVSSAMDDMAKGIAIQATSTDQTNTNVNIMSKEIEGTDKEVTHLSLKSTEMKQVSNEVLKTMDRLEKINLEMKEGIKAVNEQTKATNASVQKIAGSANLIQNIAGQTNLLALNASIEAARAGESGRGFAVVANEIGVLSSQSSQAVQTIDEIIGVLIENSEKAVEIIERITDVMESQNQELNSTENMFHQLYTNVDESIHSIELVSSMSKKMDEGRQSITQLVETLSGMAQKNASGTEETSKISASLLAEIQNLSQDLDKLMLNVRNLNSSVMRFSI